MMRSQKKFEKIAEDNNSPFFRNWLFCVGTSQYKKVLGIDGPTMAVFSRQNKIEYFTRMDTWAKAHEDFKKRAQMDYRLIEQLIDMANAHGTRMNLWTEKEIFKAPLPGYSSSKLLQLYGKYLELDALEYTYGVSLPILDFQGFSLVENSITTFLKGKVPADKLQNYFAVFTEPIRNSFFQDQEESLLRLVKKYQPTSGWRKDILALDLDDIKNRHPNFYRDLARHTSRFAWVYYVYMGPAFTEREFFEFIREVVRNKVNPAKKLLKFAAKRSRIKKLKSLYLKQLRPDPFNKSMLKLAGKMVWAKPRRKDYQSKSYYHVEKLQQELAQRLFVSLQQIRNTPLEFLETAILTNKSFVQTANEILREHVCVRVGDGRVKVLSGKEAERFVKRHVKKPAARRTGVLRQKVLSGQIAFTGKVRGRVRIINRPDEMGKMKTGDILVSIATSPSIVPAMKKAAAIVTDEGGLTCHASIVSRELETPCIVGLKYATRIFKDGDRVEVDANKGMIRKLK